MSTTIKPRIKNHGSHAREIFFSALAIAAVILLCRPLQPGGLWDFNSYYYSALASKAGLNPYDFSAVNSVIPQSGSKIARGLTFPYHPWLLPVFQFFTLFSFDTASLIYVLLLALACLVSLSIWFNTVLCVRGKGLAIFLICLLLCPGFPLFFIFRSGNTSPFESLLVWAGIYLAFYRKPLSASLYFCAAGFFKLTSFLNLAVIFPLMGLDRRRTLFVSALIGLTILLFFTPLFLGSSRFVDLWNYLKEVSLERYLNYSSTMFFFAVLESFGYERCHLFIYASWSIFVFASFIVRLKRGSEMTRSDQIALMLWTIALITPRLRPYGFFTLVPAYYASFERNSLIFTMSLGASALLYLSPDLILRHQGLFMVNLVNWVSAMTSHSAPNPDCLGDDRYR